MGAAGSMFFMKNALLAVLVISPLFGLLSTMVVESRMSFFSDALGHSAFTGIAIGTLLGSTVTLFSGRRPHVVRRSVRRGLCAALYLCAQTDQPGQQIL